MVLLTIERRGDLVIFLPVVNFSVFITKLAITNWKRLLGGTFCWFLIEFAENFTYFSGAVISIGPKLEFCYRRGSNARCNLQVNAFRLFRSSHEQFSFLAVWTIDGWCLASDQILFASIEIFMINNQVVLKLIRFLKFLDFIRPLYWQLILNCPSERQQGNINFLLITFEDIFFIVLQRKITWSDLKWVIAWAI